jgi:hypothetical protein
MSSGSRGVAYQGRGGRQVRSLADQLFDYYLVEYSFPDGTRLMAEGRQMDQCWGFFGDVIHGSKGCAVLGEGITDPPPLSGTSAHHQERDHDGGRLTPRDMQGKLGVVDINKIAKV